MQTVAVIFGGKSAEHDVSVVTALASIIKPLELTNMYQVEAIYISKDGSWYWDEKLKDISLFSSGKIDEFLRKNRQVQMQFDGGLTLTKFVGLKRKFCKIDVAFRNFLVESFGQKRDADEQQKRKREHFNGRMFLDERADRAGKQHHRDDRNDDRRDHDRNLLDHPDRRDHRIERKHDVEQRDLNDHARKRRVNLFGSVTFLAFERAVDRARCFLLPPSPGKS